MAITTPTQTIVSAEDPFVAQVTLTSFVTAQQNSTLSTGTIDPLTGSIITTSTANQTVVNALPGGLNTGSLTLNGAADKSVIIAGLTATETNVVTVDTVSVYNTDKDIYITGVDQRSIQQVLNIDEPGGSNGQVQFNDNGNLGGDDAFTYNKDTNTLSVAKLAVSDNISMPDITKLSIGGGTAGQVLLTGGGGQVYWGNTEGTGTVTSVGFDTGATGLTVSSSSTNPITSSGNFTLDGIVNVQHGGTGLSVLGSPNTYLKVNSAGTGLEYSSSTYTLPTAGVGQNGTLGGVRVDGTSILINPMGVISSYTSVVYTATAQSSGDGAIIRLTGSDTDGTHISSVKLKAGANVVINRLDTQTIEISSTGGSTSSNGTVTSVGLTVPTGFSVSGSPITTNGTLAVSTSLNGIVAGNGSGFTIVNIGTGLSYSNGTLSATGGGGGSGTVTSVGGTGTVNGLTLSGTVTTSGNLTLGGTLSNIPNSALTNNSITINGASVALGGSRTVNLSELGQVSITSPTNGQVLKYNGTAWVNGTDATGGGTTGVTQILAGSGISVSPLAGTGNVTISATGGTGTVTGVSVASANGFGGTVLNNTTTPSITLTTSVTGLIKGNGTAVSAAIAGTDYQAPITLTTTGSSGAATFVGNVLNIPQYSGGGGGSGTVTSVSGTGTVNGLTLSGTVTSSGSLTLGGTLSGISNSALTNSSVTFNGRTAALGSSSTINLADLGQVTITSPTNGQVLKYNGTAWVNETDATGSGSGTVTSVSVVPANGFTGSVATGTTTPAITLQTTVNGLLKGTSSTGVVSAAVAGTDYQAPISLTTNGSSGAATFSNGVLNIPQYSGGGGGGGGAGTLARFAVQITYDANGNLFGSPAVLAGTGTASYFDTTSTACSVTFTFTGYSSPPLSILIYGLAKAAGTYQIRTIGTDVVRRLEAGPIATSAGTAFSAFSAATHTMRLNLTKSITGTSGSGDTSAVIEFVMIT